MQAVTYTRARQHLAEVMQRVCDDHEPLIITRQKGEPVIMLSLADYNSLDTTAHLLSSPTNRARLLNALEQARAGLGVEHELVDVDEVDVH